MQKLQNAKIKKQNAKITEIIPTFEYRLSLEQKPWNGTWNQNLGKQGLPKKSV